MYFSVTCDIANRSTVAEPLHLGSCLRILSEGAGNRSETFDDHCAIGAIGQHGEAVVESPFDLVFAHDDHARSFARLLRRLHHFLKSRTQSGMVPLLRYAKANTQVHRTDEENISTIHRSDLFDVLDRVSCLD